MRSLSLGRASTVLVAALFAFVPLQPQRAAADGALAVGVPADVAKDGFAYAYSTGKADVIAARREALETCKAPGSGKSQQGRDLCSVVGSFTGECVAVAMDPGAGTPGVGWAIGGTLKIAESMAIQRCKSTAGPGRGDYCKIDNSKCDGETK